MTHYLLALHYPEGSTGPSPAELAEIDADLQVFHDELEAEGAWVFGGGLHPSSTSTLVHVKDGDVVTTDGPFAETKEQLGGFTIVRAPDLDTALRYAAKASAATRLPVEVRPFQGATE